MSDAARTALAAGDLAGCTKALAEAIRAAPGEPSLRAFLFQLSCITGAWERAVAQLDTLATLDPEAVPLKADYRPAIAAEATRQAVFEGKAKPDVFGPHAPWHDGLIEALALDAAGEAEAAAERRLAAFEAAPTTPGTADGNAFDWIADADNRLGPVLEAVMNGAYRWIPLDQLTELTLEAPRDLRDTVWAVGIATFEGGGQWPVFVPVRYPGSEAGSPGEALARETRWEEMPHGLARGIGQRILAMPQGDLPLLELRTLTLGAGDAPAEADAPDTPAD